jgi:hypothetical protein
VWRELVQRDTVEPELADHAVRAGVESSEDQRHSIPGVAVCGLYPPMVARSPRSWTVAWRAPAAAPWHLADCREGPVEGLSGPAADDHLGRGADPEGEPSTAVRASTSVHGNDNAGNPSAKRRPSSSRARDLLIDEPNRPRG